MPARHVVLLAGALACAGSRADASTTGWTDLAVRIYDNARLPAVAVDRALEAAASTLAPAALEVRWIQCTTSASAARPSASCDRPLAARELAVRLVRSPVPAGYRGTAPLGDAFIDTRSMTGVLATIYLDRVEWLASGARVDLPTLLGHTIAHELGHLLIGSSAHGAHGGLMRPLWTRDEVRLGRTTDWRFAQPDLVRLQARAGRFQP